MADNRQIPFQGGRATISLRLRTISLHCCRCSRLSKQLAMNGPFDYWFSGGSQRSQPKAPAAPVEAPLNPVAGNVSNPPGNVTATSIGHGGNTFMTPDISKYHGNFDPSKYVYSVPAGGYITAEEASNANSAQ